MSNLIVLDQKQSLLSPENYDHYLKVAEIMSKSDMVPKAYKGRTFDVLIAMEMGASMGMGPLQAVQNIAVVNGRPSLYGDGLLAVCAGHPDFKDMQEEPILDDNGKLKGYKCTVMRRNRKPLTQTFTIEQAKHAGLWDKVGPWKTYPARMLQMRARAFALRDSFSDALGGIRCVEEVQDYDVKDITPKNAESSNKLDSLLANKAKPKIEHKPAEIINKETGEIKEAVSHKSYREAKGE